MYPIRMESDATEIPEEVQRVIAEVLNRRPPIDLVMFYAKWALGMKSKDIAERVHHTPEYVRLRLKTIYRLIRLDTEKIFGKHYRISIIARDDNGTP